MMEVEKCHVNLLQIHNIDGIDLTHLANRSRSRRGHGGGQRSRQAKCGNK